MNTSILTVVLAACPLAAQAVSLTTSAATPITVQAALNAVVQLQTVPAGPMPASGFLGVQASSLATGGGHMQVSWQTTLPAHREHLTFGLGIWGWAHATTGSASASFDPFEVLVHLHAPTPRRVFVTGHVDMLMSPGQVMPTLEIDLFDDGAAEWTTTTAPTRLPLLVGPTPIPVRFRGSVLVTQGGSAQGGLSIDVTPDNRIDVQEFVQGCAAPGVLLVEEAFPHDGVRLRVASGTFIAVLGLGVQPQLLPAYHGFPCLLLPSPDLLAVIPTGGLDLPIPAAARPIDVYAQAVWLDSETLTTTAGFRVSAF